MHVSYRISDIRDYINWAYFFHAWGLTAKFASIARIHNCEACLNTWVQSFDEGERRKAKESLSLFKEANHLLSTMENRMSVKAVVELFKCHAEGDDIVVLSNNGKHTHLPMLRQQRQGNDGFCMSLADFIHDEKSGITDIIGIFATSATVSPPPISASQSIELHNSTIDNEGHDSLLLQTLADRLAEAAAERLHEQVRKEIWGYAPDESLSISELHAEKFQGIRPAIGYPCLPDISLNFLIDELIDLSSVGITLTEHAMMRPHASVSGLMMSHTLAHYFDVGDITEEQLADYARRRNMPVDIMRKYIKT